MSINLLLAIHAEHKARTGHDVFTEPPLSIRAINCDVCAAIKAEKREMEEAEKRYYESLHHGVGKHEV